MEFNVRTDEEFLAAFDNALPKFQWIIDDYLKPIVLQRLQSARRKQQVTELKSLLRDIWFKAPVAEFSMTNPKGWKELIGLVVED